MPSEGFQDRGVETEYFHFGIDDHESQEERSTDCRAPGTTLICLTEESDTLAVIIADQRRACEIKITYSFSQN